MAETAEKRSWKWDKEEDTTGEAGERQRRKERRVGRQYKDHKRQGTNKAMEQERVVGRVGREDSKAGERQGRQKSRGEAGRQRRK